MDTDQLNLQELLAENGFSLVRQRKHAIYRNAQGRIWVTPVSVSDVHAFKNNLAQFRKFLTHGIVKQATRDLGITGRDRLFAENLLHPTRIKPRRDVMKRRRERVPAAPARVPHHGQERKKRIPDVGSDAYKVGSIVQRVLLEAFRRVLPVVLAEVVRFFRADCERKCAAMKAQGATEIEIAVYAERQYNRCRTYACDYAKRLPRVAHAVARVFQKSLRRPMEREEVIREVEAILERILGGRQGFSETAEYITAMFGGEERWKEIKDKPLPLPPIGPAESLRESTDAL